MSVKNQEKRREKVVCPCQSGKAYYECCEVYHQGAIPITAESLMRSRFTAFTYQLEAITDGYYKNVRTNEMVYLKEGEVWKYVETTQGEKRYSKSSY